MPAGFIAPAAIAGLSYLGGRNANRTNREIAREQMAFQERMSSTAYQRAVEDMRAAGINPMVAYQQGGASSPSGAGTRVEDAISPAVSSGMHAKRMIEEIKNLRENRKLTAMQTNVARATANREQTQAHLNVANEMESESRRKLNQYDAAGRSLRSRIDRSDFGKAAAYIERLRTSMFGGGSPLPRIGGR